MKLLVECDALYRLKGHEGCHPNPTRANWGHLLFPGSWATREEGVGGTAQDQPPDVLGGLGGLGGNAWLLSLYNMESLLNGVV